MSEGERQASDLRKTISLPRPDRALVGADDKIELHGTEASLLGSDERMFEHQAGDTLALRLRRRHVSTICDVIPGSSLVCTQKVRSENIGVVFRNESLVVPSAPIGDSISFVDVPGNGVGFPSTEHGSQDRPDG